jgi:hypothetical protein
VAWFFLGSFDHRRNIDTMKGKGALISTFRLKKSYPEGFPPKQRS